VQRLREVIQTSLEKIVSLAEPTSKEPAPPPAASFWSRWLGWGKDTVSVAVTVQQEDTKQRERRLQAQQAADQVRELLGSRLTGYSMSLRRIERTLEQYNLEPIACVGEPFDPEMMEVVEVAADPNRPAGEVLEEVRRGYLWHGRVFRYAQVRVTKN